MKRRRVNKLRTRFSSLKGLDAVTKKDFQAIADILCDHSARRGMVSDMADYFRSQNPRFNRDRFIDAVAKCKRK